MANESIPYLCGGTFFTQLLRARPVLTTSTEHTKGHKKASLNKKRSGGLFQFIK